MMSSSAFSRQIRILRSDAHRPVIHFFEKHEAAIRNLDAGEYLDILLIYLDALFACGEYRRFLERVDEGLVLSLDARLQTLDEGEVYHHLLFRKAAAAWHDGDLSATEHILRQLVRLQPDHPLAARFLTRCLSAGSKSSRQNIRAATILLFLLSAIVLAVETLWFHPFLPNSISLVEATRNVLFLSAWLIWGGGELGLYLSARAQTRRWQRQAKPRDQAIPEQVRAWH